MTMPVERTRALRQAGELLRALNRRPDIPEYIRRWAEGVLRHYPEEWQLRLMAEEWQRLGASAFGLAPEPDRPDPLLALKLPLR
jgi:hypothetical protein